MTDQLKKIEAISLADRYGAHNYEPLPVALERGSGIWVYDNEGRRYMDCLSAYSALNQGHCHPRIIAALNNQSARLTLTSRAFHNDRMGPFLKKLCKLARMDRALLMNSGAEAVETAIKAARKWGYITKGIPDNKAEIIVCKGNFHGRTITAVSASSEPAYKACFGPLTPGFVLVPYADSTALEDAITPHTVAVMLEPVQGEGGVIIPPVGYLRDIRQICQAHNILFMLDEIQTGLGRTGALFCWQHEPDAKPDVITVGKALGGGVYPISAALGCDAVMGLFQPGDHGSTFGGNPLAAAVGEAALDVIVEEKLSQRSKELGAYLFRSLKQMHSPAIKEIRGKGLFVGIELSSDVGDARPWCEKLMRQGILVKETHKTVIRIAPPLIITKEELDILITRMKALFVDSI